MSVWNFIHQKLWAGIPIILLYVLDSQGSSPGRQGFKMAVAGDGEICGSVGGGIMEHKWVEKARDMLLKGERSVIIKEQIHNKESPENQSGMICSGRQTIALVPLQKTFLSVSGKLLSNDHSGTIILTPAGIRFSGDIRPGDPFYFQYTDGKNWEYCEAHGFRPTLHIIGGGHVGLAFSRLMATLGFYLIVYDDRPGLNTMEQNSFANEKLIVDFNMIGDIIQGGPHDFAVIMTFGYRSDKLIIRQLLEKKFRYLGMMGSEAKIARLYSELKEEGIPEAAYSHVHAPVGVPIYSKTPAEIAVSIAAEIIRVKNEGLPTGRT